MSVEFGASRVTIRRALELVREDGLIAARQGFGWFVATEPVRQSLQSLGTIESQVEGGGKLSERKVEEFAFETRAGSGPQAARRRPGAAGQAGQPGRRRAVRRGHRVVPRRARRQPVARRRRAAAVLRTARPRSARRHPDDRGRPRRRGRCPVARRAARLAGAAVPARHHRPARDERAGQRARLPGPPHRVRRRAARRPNRR